MAKAKTYWFVEPLDVWTNSVIYSEVSTNLGLEETQYDFLVDRDGLIDEVNVWEVPHSVITKLYHNKRAMNLYFRVYARKGQNALPKLWKFEDTNYRRESKVIRKK